MTIELVNSLILNSISGNTGSGGWTANTSVFTDADEVVYGRQVDIFQRSEYNGGIWTPEKLAFSGHIMPQTLVFDRKQATDEITLATTDAFLNSAALQGIYFSEQASPANLHQMTGLTLAKIVEHIIENHTGVTTFSPDGWVETADIDTDGDSTTINVMTVHQSNSIWNTLKIIGDNEFYVRFMDKEDNFHYKAHPQFATSPPSVSLAITEDMIIGQPAVSFRNITKIDQVQLYALTDTGQTLRSDFPSNIASDRRRQKLSNLRCNTQGRLDVLAERAFDWLNRDVKFRVNLVGAFGLWLELYDRVSVTYTGTVTNSTNTRVIWSAKKFWIDEVNVSRVGNFGAMTELSLDEDTS